LADITNSMFISPLDAHSETVDACCRGGSPTELSSVDTFQLILCRNSVNIHWDNLHVCFVRGSPLTVIKIHDRSKRVHVLR